MKTLVIHPHDPTTEFLKEIYSDKDWTVMDLKIPKRLLKEQIKLHDRIIMLGHGTEKGLIGFHNLIVGSDLVYLLREKETVCIWCNADVFVNKYGLKGLHTGMIISEYGEAIDHSVRANTNQIHDSNDLFASSIKESLDIDRILSSYSDEDNPIVCFNKKNIFKH